jgi:integrase/recombinase XerD
MRHSRHTFAVELLLAGMPIDQVSILLGHSSVKVTEKHYAPFVKLRQEQLAQLARMAWEQMEEKRSATPVKSKKEAPKGKAATEADAIPTQALYRQL